ncbi:MAG: hypothetical protein KAJ14_16395 [Candidatus Omnitrophica bacterium]|nr:hypothetical protein [Candidatus Omnitrophota bacterium]
MADISNCTISIQDSERLKKSFFSPTEEKGIKVNNPRKKLYFLIPISLFIIVGIIILLKFYIVFLPRENLVFQDNSFNLMNPKVLGNIKALNPSVTYKFNNGYLYVDIPYDNKNGFILNFKDTINVSDTEMELSIKSVSEDFNLYVILRDDEFYSNSLNPVKVEVTKQNEKSFYRDISIKIDEGLTPNINLNRINHMRFIFYQKKVSLVNMLIKNIALKNRR